MRKKQKLPENNPQQSFSYFCHLTIKKYFTFPRLVKLIAYSFTFLMVILYTSYIHPIYILYISYTFFSLVVMFPVDVRSFRVRCYNSVYLIAILYFFNCLL
jgi:hypothetical protein